MSNKLKRKKNDAVTVRQFRQAVHAMDESIEKQLKLAEQEIHQATQNHLMGLMLCIFSLVLRKCLKFGPVRTLRVLNEVAAVINDMHDGLITVFDVKRDAEEVGIKVVFNANYDIIETGIFEEDKYASARKKVDDERLKLYKEFDHEGARLWTHPEWKE